MHKPPHASGSEMAAALLIGDPGACVPAQQVHMGKLSGTRLELQYGLVRTGPTESLEHRLPWKQQ